MIDKRLIFPFLLASSPAFGGNIEDDLNAIAVETQRYLPKRVAEGVTSTTIASLGKTLMMQYRLDMGNKEFNGDSTIVGDLTKSSVSTQCSTPQMRSFIKRGATLRYMFFSKDGVFLSEIAVNDEICRRSGF